MTSEFIDIFICVCLALIGAYELIHGNVNSALIAFLAAYAISNAAALRVSHIKNKVERMLED
jgi:uncharacterized membrane protein